MRGASILVLQRSGLAEAALLLPLIIHASGDESGAVRRAAVTATASIENESVAQQLYEGLLGLLNDLHATLRPPRVHCKTVVRLHSRDGQPHPLPAYLAGL